MVMGQGAGTCTALALASGVDMAKVEIGKLQGALRKDGTYLEDVPGEGKNSRGPAGGGWHNEKQFLVGFGQEEMLHEWQ
jgi:hypothetical protein